MEFFFRGKITLSGISFRIDAEDAAETKKLVAECMYVEYDINCAEITAVKIDVKTCEK